MGRKSLGAGRLAASLGDNDDAAERKDRRRTLLKHASQEELEEQTAERRKAQGASYDLSSVINLVASNKLNVNNTWNVDLLDHIEDVLDAHAGSFQKASCTLQASVSIYEKRVDSTHQDTFKMLENVNRTRIGAAGDAEESRAKRKQAAGAKNWGAQSHLESNLSNITHLRVEREYEVDPLFRKMSKTFDAGGAKGLLLNHLNVHQGPAVVFDTGDTPAFPGAAPKSLKTPQAMEEEEQDRNPAIDDQHEEKRVSWLRGITTSNNNPACPSLEVLHRTMDICESRGSEATPEVPDDDEAPLPEELPAAFVNNPTDDSHGGQDLYYEDEGAGFYFEGHDEDVASVGSDPNSDEDAKSPNTAGPGRDAPSPAQGNSLLALVGDLDFSHASAYAFFRPQTSIDSKNVNWAGMSHWRFGQAGKRALPTTRDNSTARSKKKTTYLDFFAEHELLVAPTRASSINLSGTTRSACLDLPEDLHYSVRDLCKLFLKPVIISELLHPSKELAAGNECTGDDHDAGFFDTHDDGDAQYGDYENRDGQPGQSGDHLVAPSHILENVHVDYARKAKVVDVKKLKASLWEQVEAGLESCAKNTQEEHAAEMNDEPEHDAASGVSFAETVALTAPIVADSNVTVPFYFICLLHLANENNLSLEGRADMSDFFIH